jgi:hypothetical protein
MYHPVNASFFAEGPWFGFNLSLHAPDPQLTMLDSGFINRWSFYGATYRQMHELLGLQTGLPKRKNHRRHEGISLSGMRFAA